MTRIVLYDNPKIGEARMFQPVDSKMWAKYQRNAVRYLRAAGARPDIVHTLEYLPFTCDEQVYFNNYEEPFGSGDHLLTLKVPVEIFVEIENEERNWPNRQAEHFPIIAHALGRVGCRIWRIIAEIELDAENKPVELVQGQELTITSETVEHALSQARTLIVSHGAPAALDRVHTVFHAYLKAACETAKIPVTNDRPGIIELLGLLRKHGVFAFEPELETLVTQTLRGAQKSVDALETFRNQFSLAHPQEMLPEPEALLVINLTQAMLRYIDARLRTD